ncbi:hypothetical protein [Pseudomonas aeruginosa]|uniref:hypothetical protein n=1 Tax=Pseudomonas aeruginosa TaxID=287 RepID=UPI0003BB2647|nr:hypothetical protein [Pseudomonas aeruginosa]ERZ01120.1 hypothetical protein Q022_02262 [Pseudomonas aeruginosa BWHPSA009]MCO1949116.1 hypothetical protein [Pseudomonas aeruginosa]
MLAVVLLALQIISSLVCGEAAIRKYPEGAAALDKLSNAGLFFLRWRAYADYKSELKHLRNFFGAIAIIFTIIFFINGQGRGEPTLINALPGLFIILWATMHFGINVKQGIREQLSVAGLLFIAPWIFFIAEYAGVLPPGQLQLMATPFKIFGILNHESYVIALALSLIGVITGVVMALISSLVLSIIPLVVLFLMISTSNFARAMLRVNPKTAYHFSLIYFLLIGPALILAESKGVFG